MLKKLRDRTGNMRVPIQLLVNCSFHAAAEKELNEFVMFNP